MRMLATERLVLPYSVLVLTISDLITSLVKPLQAVLLQRRLSYYVKVFTPGCDAQVGRKSKRT
jgi:hypothetical protein